MDTVTNPVPVRPKTKPTGRHPSNALSAAFLRSAPPGRHADGNGLYLFVQPSGTRSWIQRLVVRGRRRELGLGSVALVPLAEAREKARGNRKLAREGGDPLAEKRRAEGIPTFAEAASRVLEQKRGGWRGRRHHREWMASLRRYAFPRIGKMPVSEVTSADLLEILTPIWHRKASSARRVRQRLRVVLEWAVAMEYRLDNPCDRIGPVLGPQHDVTEHMRALPHGEVAAAIRTVRAAAVPEVAKLAFELLVLTAARWSEVRWAEWAEINRDAGVWTVPARRMKANRKHRVPLCGRALEILEAARTLGEGSGPLVFSRRGGKPLNDKELRWLVREQGIAAVPHGFRSSFRDWAAEETDHPREVIEAALAHVVRNRVEAAYARSDLFERRRVLMNDWARYLAQGIG
ncbi:MAG: integrase arm-type DNA-binding domain-containing protein [Acidobacteria bacterium]|nr:integrase arm-type DNA-binding domain-containing protein [Acidobacteriota bacterium]